MSDDERIARLTELARGAFPNDACHIYGQRADGVAGSVVVRPDRAHVLVMAGDGSYMPICIEHHPRAADALEAALLVLSGARMMVMVPPTRGYVPFEPGGEHE